MGSTCGAEKHIAYCADIPLLCRYVAYYEVQIASGRFVRAALHIRVPAVSWNGSVEIRSSGQTHLNVSKAHWPSNEKAGQCQEFLWLGKFISNVFICPDIR